MKFTSNKFRLTPEVPTLSFSFDDLYLTNVTGSAEIGFSGTGERMRWLFESGNIYDPDGSFVKSYNANERIDISGDSKETKYRYYINNNLYKNGTKNSYNVTKFFANVTGVEMNSDIRLGMDSSFVSTGINTSSSFIAASQISGGAEPSDYPYRIFSGKYSTTELSNSFVGSNLKFRTTSSGWFSGDVGSTGLSFYFSDPNPSLSDSNMSVKVSMDTSLGLIKKNFTIFRSGNVTGNINIIDYSDFADEIINYEFDGTGFSNGYEFAPAGSGENCKALYYMLLNNDGIETPKTINYHIYPITDVSGVTGTGEFITGYNSTNSGFYEEVPDYYFTSFSKITGADFDADNLFSEGCGTSIPVTFDALSGYGVSGSGTALLQRVRIALYGSETFYTITGINIVNEGSGYNYAPVISVKTGDLGATCFDVPHVSGDSYIYTPFTGSGVREPVADYFYGNLLTGESILTISGTGYTGYAITGIRFTNPGSGFNEASGYIPELIITRPSNTFQSIYDVSGFHQSGSFVFNDSGDYYDFLQNWVFETGLKSTGLSQMATGDALSVASGYSGSINMPSGERHFHICMSFTQPALTQDYEIGIAIEPSGQSDTSGVISVVSGITTYPTGTGAYWTVPFDPTNSNLISF